MQLVVDADVDVSLMMMILQRNHVVDDEELVDERVDVAVDERADVADVADAVDDDQLI